MNFRKLRVGFSDKVVIITLAFQLGIPMPTALRIGSYRFYFYSYDCGEPRHMHIDREDKSAKFWLDPMVSLVESHGYSRKELRDIERIATENLELLRNEWDNFCGSNTPSA